MAHLLEQLLHRGARVCRELQRRQGPARARVEAHKEAVGDLEAREHCAPGDDLAGLGRRVFVGTRFKYLN